MNNKIKRIVIISIFTALQCIISPISIYVGPVPFSLSLFIILVNSSLFNKFVGFFITLLYILLGIFGLPIFAGGMGGIGVITGPTGGFIIGYLVCSLVISLLTNLNNKSNILMLFSYILGILLCYTFGLVHYMNEMNVELIDAIIVCVYPFIVFDSIKIIISFIIVVILKNKLKSLIVKQ